MMYKLPRYVECLVDRANQELPHGVVVVPWTKARCVVVKKNGVRMMAVPYELIEDDLVGALDRITSPYKPR